MSNVSRRDKIVDINKNKKADVIEIGDAFKIKNMEDKNIYIFHLVSDETGSVFEKEIPVNSKLGETVIGLEREEEFDYKGREFKLIDFKKIKKNKK